MSSFGDYKLRGHGILIGLNKAALTGDTTAYEASEAELDRLLHDVNWQAREWELENMKSCIPEDEYESRVEKIRRMRRV